MAQLSYVLEKSIQKRNYYRSLAIERPNLISAYDSWLRETKTVIDILDHSRRFSTP